MNLSLAMRKRPFPQAMFSLLLSLGLAPSIGCAVAGVEDPPEFIARADMFEDPLGGGFTAQPLDGGGVTADENPGSSETTTGGFGTGSVLGGGTIARSFKMKYRPSRSTK